MQPERTRRYWRYLALDHKRCYRRNMFSSMLIVYGIATGLILTSVLWPVPQRGDTLFRWESAGSDSGPVIRNGIGKSAPEQQHGNTKAQNCALIPGGITTSGYRPDIRIVPDQPLAVTITSRQHEPLANNLGATGVDEVVFYLESEESLDILTADDFDDGLGPDTPYMPDIRLAHTRALTAAGGIDTRGKIKLANFIWPNRIDHSATGTVVLEVTIPKSKLRPKEYKVLYDDAGFSDAVVEMLDRSSIKAPLRNGERMEVTVRWTFKVSWSGKDFFVSEKGLFEESD